MKAFLLSVLICSFSFIAFGQTVTLSGKVSDPAGKAVPFASVYVKNTTKGASANAEGDYALSLPSGHYDLQFKAVGYKQESRSVELQTSTTLNVTLSNEIYELKSVSVNASGEDPAYAIIRKAIKKRKAHLGEPKAYTCLVYIKGLQKLLAAPKKFMGFDIQKAGKEIGLDSNRRGIVYLSESESKLSYQYPGQLHEEMISSKFSGSNQMFSFNRASDARVNFYENFQNWGGLSNRPLVSPISDNALFYYRYKLLGTSSENGVLINKIRVSPRRAHDPCFDGIIYIIDQSWRIYGLDLQITSRAGINFVDTLRINQQFMPLAGAWVQASNKFEFRGGLLGFRLQGYFLSVYKDYDLDPVFKKHEFNELLHIPQKVNKSDTEYWNRERPLPLTAEEKTDYTKKAILAKKRESKSYLDSLDRQTNKVSPGGLVLTGVTIINRYKREFFHLDPLISSLQFNTVEGPVLNYGMSFRKQADTNTNKHIAFAANLRYGFSDHLFNAKASARVPLGEYYLNIQGGSDVLDLNNNEAISTLVNTAYTLFERQNYLKLYERKFVAARLSGRITGGWQVNASVEWADRKWLPNANSYSFFDPGHHEFTSNNPLLPDQDIPLFAQNQSLKVTLRTTYDFSNKYETYPFGRRYLPSQYPTIGLAFTDGIRSIFGSDVDYKLLSADLSKKDIDLGVYGRSSFYLAAGKFLDHRSLSFPDYTQFGGNQVLFYRNNISSFLLLDYYRFSTYTQFLEAHLEHNFSGFITNKIPLVRKLKLQEILDFNYLDTPELHNYYELGFGLQYLSFRVMYATSFHSGLNAKNGLRLGLSF